MYKLTTLSLAAALAALAALAGTPAARASPTGCPGAPAVAAARFARIDDQVHLVLVGNTALATPDVLAAMAAAGAAPPVTAAGALDQDALERDLLQLAAVYWDRGYANVKVGEPTIDLPHHQISIPVQEGPRFTIASVQFTGELLGGPRRHLELVQLRPGVTFSRTMIADARMALSTDYADRGYFSVNILPLSKVDLTAQQIALTFEIERGPVAHIGRILVAGNTHAPAVTGDVIAAVRRDLGIFSGERFNATKLLAGKCRVLALDAMTDVEVATKHGATADLVDILVDVSQ